MSYADIIKKRQKDWNCPDLVNNIYKVHGTRIPFSSPLMNWFTYGGVPRNKITEFHGDFGSGKSTTSLDICNNAVKLFCNEYDEEVAKLQEAVSSGNKAASMELDELHENGPRKVVYLDVEHAFDVTWAKTLSVDLDHVDVIQPPDIPAEELLQMVREIVETGEIGLIVLDSIPALIPQKVLEKKIGEKTVAALAGLLDTFYKVIIPLLTRYKCTMIMINQIRENFDNPYVVKTPGGSAPRFYSSLRLLFRKGKPVDFLGNELPQSTENPAGCIISAQITKQKTAPNDRKAGTYFLMFQSGIRPDYDYATLAIKNYGIIKKAGAWFTLCDPETGEIIDDPTTQKPVKLNGLGKVYEYLQANEKYYQKLVAYIDGDINKSGDDDGEQTD